MKLRCQTQGRPVRFKACRGFFFIFRNCIKREHNHSCRALRRDVASGGLLTAAGMLFFSPRSAWVNAAVVQEDLADKGVEKRSMPDFTQPGPFKAVRIPNLEHTCASCFPKCVGDRCLLRIFVTYPAGRMASTFKPPYPIAIISGGFLVKGEMYQSYAERLATWGYVAIVYDKVESILDALDDVISAAFIREIIDYCEVDPLLSQLVIPDQVYLIGHSRGGKVSVLAAEDDDRVVGLCLIDPVDNTVYAPISPGFPSAVSAMRTGSRSIPIAVIGGGQSVDCAPVESNYKRFYDAAKSMALEVVLKEAGHFQFLDNQNTLQKSVCVQGRVTDEVVRYSTQSVMIAWGEALFRERMLMRVQAGSPPVNPVDSFKLVLRKISQEKNVDLETQIKNYSMLRTWRQSRNRVLKW